MSRQSPFGFALSIVFEIAAVVAIVSLLPRVDLRPTTAAEASFAPARAAPAAVIDPAISRVNWNAADKAAAQPPIRETTFFERPAPRSISTSRESQPLVAPEAPPLIEPDPARSQYVEQRLDRASQQLVNSVGSYVTQAAGNLANYQPVPTTAPTFSATSPATTTYLPATPSFPGATPQPAPRPGTLTTPRHPSAGSFATQPRPWLRY